MNHKLRFRTFFATLRSNQLSGQTGDLLNCRKSSKYFRILANQQIRVAMLNVRGLNQPTKKESLIHIMKEHGYVILLMTETNVNIGCVETWDGYTVFYSTSIYQKIRKRERNKRETAVASGARQLDPGTSHRLAEDFEHAGVGIVIKNSLVNSIKHVRQRNGRIISITFSCSACFFLMHRLPIALVKVMSWWCIVWMTCCDRFFGTEALASWHQAELWQRILRRVLGAKPESDLPYLQLQVAQRAAPSRTHACSRAWQLEFHRDDRHRDQAHFGSSYVYDEPCLCFAPCPWKLGVHCLKNAPWKGKELCLLRPLLVWCACDPLIIAESLHVWKDSLFPTNRFYR